jgi:nudix-type nucleoside diphosphatase (YffH/AdpP family)
MRPMIMASRTQHQGWSSLRLITLDLGDGTRIDRQVEDHGTAVAVLPFDPSRRLAVLVRQLRAPVVAAGQHDDLLEAPAGLQDGTDADDDARREVLEETGIRLAHLERVVRAWSMPGLSLERITLYLAEYGAADRIAPGGGLDDEHERITVAEMPLAQLAAMADAGELDDLKTFALVQTLRLKRPDLFAP